MVVPEAEESGRWPLETKGSLVAPGDRERLIDAMAGACAAKGYAATEIDDVLAATGVERSVFDRNFADKADCALAAVNEILAEIAHAAAAAFSPELADWEKLIHAVRALLELLAAQPSYARLACIEARSSMPQEAYERYTAGIRVLIAMLDRARDYAALSVPASATRGAIGGAEFLVRRELIAGRAEHLPRLLPDIIYGTVVPFLDQHEALHYRELAKELIKEGG
jgi:AcrR family transcriptional regulator